LSNSSLDVNSLDRELKWAQVQMA